MRWISVFVGLLLCMFIASGVAAEDAFDIEGALAKAPPPAGPAHDVPDFVKHYQRYYVYVTEFENWCNALFEDQCAFNRTDNVVCILNNVVKLVITFITYNVMPGAFVILFIYFMLVYGKQALSDHTDDRDAWEYGKRILFLLVGIYLLLPANITFLGRVSDQRPTGMWLIGQTAKTAMGSAGWVSNQVKFGIKSYATSSLASGTNADPNFKVMQSLVTMLDQWQGSGDEIQSFLTLPLYYGIFYESGRVDVANQAKELEDKIKNNDELAQEYQNLIDKMSMEAREKKEPWWQKILSPVAGLLEGATAGFTMGGLKGAILGSLFGVGAHIPGVREGLMKLLSSTATYFAETGFMIGIVGSYYIALLFFLLHVLFLMIVLPITAFIIPLGRFGEERFWDAILHLATILLWPIFMVFFFVIALIVRWVYVHIIQNIMIAITGMLTFNSAYPFLPLLMVNLIFPLIIIGTLSFLILRVPGYIGKVLRHQVLVDHGDEARFRLPFTRN